MTNHDVSLARGVARTTVRSKRRDHNAAQTCESAPVSN